MSDSTTADVPSPAGEAARWFLRLQENATSLEVFIEWQRWLHASSENRAAYEDIEDTVFRLERLPSPPKLPSLLERAQDRYDGTLSIAQWNRSCGTPDALAELDDKSDPRWPSIAAAIAARSDPAQTRPVWLRWTALAAGVAALVLSGSLSWWQHLHTLQLDGTSYHTAPGERRVLKLADGSTVTLDADSALKVLLTAQERSLRLEHGEAYFQVAKDPHRPFVLNAGSTHITVLGTAFNVHLSDDRTIVAVTEGKVDLVIAPKAAASSAGWPSQGETAVSQQQPSAAARQMDSGSPVLEAQVAAGQAISYQDDGQLRPLPAKEVSLAVSWLAGRRQYRSEPLRYVLADVDRYTGRRIEVADAAAGDLRFTGTLSVNDSDGWLRGLTVALPVAITEKEDGVLSIAMRKPTAF